jgi:glycine cleavage system H protein
MSKIPFDLRYAATHEWAKAVGDDVIEVGISDFAQEALGDVVYVELPEPGTPVEAGTECAAVESVKAASDIYAPVSGEIAEVNPALEDNPEIINQDSYGAGWLYRIKASDTGQLEKLLTADGYKAEIGE